MGNTQKNTPVDIQVRIDKLLDSDSSTKAFASATIGNAFAVHDIRITEKDDKVIVNMPFRSYKSGGETKYVDTSTPSLPSLVTSCTMRSRKHMSRRWRSAWQIWSTKVPPCLSRCKPFQKGRYQL